MLMPGNPKDARSRVELLWGEGRDRSRGPRPRLSLERIAATAIEIADADGLDAVSMQRVAKELGYTTMSLYRYVPDKDQLIEVMLDHCAGEPPPAPDSGCWRADVEAWVHGLWQLYTEHPWMLRVRISAPPMGPGQLQWLEAVLAPLARSGLADAELVPVATMLLGMVRQFAALATDMTDNREQLGISTAEAEAEYEATLRRFVTEDRFPTLARLTEGRVFRPSGLADSGIGLDLEFGLKRFLDGVESYVGGRAR